MSSPWSSAPSSRATRSSIDTAPETFLDGVEPLGSCAPESGGGREGPVRSPVARCRAALPLQSTQGSEESPVRSVISEIELFGW